MAYIYDLQATWNNIATVFDAISMNVSNGAGGAPVASTASRILNLKKNGTSVFSIDIDGLIYSNGFSNFTTSSIITSTTVGVGDAAVTIFKSAPTGRPLTFSWVYGQGTFNNGPVGDNPYITYDWAFGSNLSGLNTRLNLSYPATYIQFESTFYQSPTAAKRSELHIGFKGLDDIEHRVITMEFPWLGGNIGVGRTAHLNLSFDQQNIGNYNADLKAQWNFETTPGTLTLSDSTFINVGYNNLPFTKQLSSDLASFVNLPYIDSGDVLKGSQPVYFTGPRAGAAAVFPGNFATFYPVTANAGDIIVQAINSSLLVGSLFAFFGLGYSVDGIQNRIQCNGAGVGAHAFTECFVAAGGGDPFDLFTVSGGRQVAVGIDHSDSSAFVMSINSVLGTNNFFRADANRNVALGKSAPATNATDGFMYWPACAGVPTGVPTAITGYCAGVVDNVNNKAYIYSGGAWQALN